MMYAYFPGCSAHSTGISYTNSYNYVALAAGIELKSLIGTAAAHRQRMPASCGRCASRVRLLFRKKRSAMLLY